MTYDPSSQTQVAAKNRRERRAAERRKATMRRWLEDPEGRALMWSILESAKVFATTFTANAWSGFNEGRRALGLEILALVTEADPEAFVVAMKEANKNTKREADADLALSMTPEKEDADA